VACSRAGHRVRGTRGGAATSGKRNGEVECRTAGEHGVDRGSQPGNFTESRTHPRVVAAVGWREAVGTAVFGDGAGRAVVAGSRTRSLQLHMRRGRPEVQLD
jgi:hypothetical protein